MKNNINIKYDTELRSDKVRNIVGQIPSLLLRQGIVIIALVLLVFIGISIFIPYRKTLQINLTCCSKLNECKIKRDLLMMDTNPKIFAKSKIKMDYISDIKLGENVIFTDLKGIKIEGIIIKIYPIQFSNDFFEILISIPICEMYGTKFKAKVIIKKTTIFKYILN